MTKEEIFGKLKEIMVETFDLDADEIRLESRLGPDLDMDSIDAVDLIVKMKAFTKQKLEAEQFKSARTVQDVVDILAPLV